MLTIIVPCIIFIVVYPLYEHHNTDAAVELIIVYCIFRDNVSVTISQYNNDTLVHVYNPASIIPNQVKAAVVLPFSNSLNDTPPPLVLTLFYSIHQCDHDNLNDVKSCNYIKILYAWHLRTFQNLLCDAFQRHSSTKSLHNT